MTPLPVHIAPLSLSGVNAPGYNTISQTALVRIIDINHPLVRLGNEMDWQRREGIEGDQVNAILSATGMNFGKLLKAASRLP